MFGAAGKAGSRVVAEAAARGHEVTAVARDLSRIASVPGGVRLVSGDVTDAGTVADLGKDADALVLTVGGPDARLYTDAVASVASAGRSLAPGRAPHPAHGRRNPAALAASARSRRPSGLRWSAPAGSAAPAVVQQVASRSSVCMCLVRPSPRPSRPRPPGAFRDPADPPPARAAVRLRGYAAPRSTERRCSALAHTSSTGPFSLGSAVRMVSCSRTYQPS